MKTVNILGDTPREQWMNAIGIYELCICENIKSVIKAFERDNSDFDWEDETTALEKAERAARDFAGEMRRLVEGVFE